MQPQTTGVGRVSKLIACLAGLALSSYALAQDQGALMPTATQQVLSKYHGAKAEMQKGRVVSVYGKPMTSAAEPFMAAEHWLDENKQAFDVNNLELLPKWDGKVSHGKFTVVAYDQTIEGIPVEFGQARVLVLNKDGQHTVVYAGGKFAKPTKALNEVRVTADQALDGVRNLPMYSMLESWSQPSLVVYFGEGDREDWIEPVKAWKFVGQIPAIDRLRKLTFIVDASTGALLAARNEILNIDVQGEVRAMATPTPQGRAEAHHSGNPPVSQVVPDVAVRVVGGTEVFATVFGTFVIPNAGSSSVQVQAGLNDGRWTVIGTDGQGTPILSATQSVTPPGPANLLLNPTPNEFTTAQANTYIAVTTTHNYVLDRAPTFTQLNPILPINVNMNSVSGYTSCNAVYSGDATNYLKAAGGCNNTGFSSVASHEYGHHIVATLGLAQGAFGEGFGDTMSILIWDDPIIGRYFRTDGSPVRTPATANIQYPCSSSCSGAIHCCGQIIGGVVWRLREGFVSTYGLETGKDLVRQLHVDWMMITNGGSGSNSAHPQTAIEMLTVDDDDGDLENGTPNYAIICAAFSPANISCPALAPIDFVYPDGRPALITPNQPTTVRVNVVSLGQSPTPGTGQMFVSINGGAFTATAMTQTQSNQYVATIPAIACGDNVRYYFRAGSTGGNVTDPSNAPTSSFSAVGGTGTSTIFYDNFETNQGWNSPAPTHTATSGIWTRVDPVGTSAQPEDDASPSPGTMCYVTGQGSVGGADGTADVDGGATFLVSPVLDLSQVADAKISYYRWYSNSAGGAPNADTFRVDISSNNGGTWTNVETVGPSGAGTGGGWIYHEFNLSQFPGVAHTTQMRVRFVAEDAGTGSLIEAGVDEFKVEAITCEIVPPPQCDGDTNGDNMINSADLSVLLSQFNQSVSPAGSGADFNSDGVCDSADLSLLLARFGQTCK